MKIAHVSTFRTSCGVGLYLEELCNALAGKVEQKVFAETTAKELPSMDPSVTVPYVRCYTRGGSYDDSLKNIAEYNPDIVHIQFESSMYQESYKPDSPYIKFLNDLHSKGFKTVMTFHNILPKPDWSNSETRQISDWYNGLNSKVICCNETTKNAYLKWSPSINAISIPLGSPIYKSIPREEALSKLVLDKTNIYIVQPGFYGADKGMVQLVQAMPEILMKYPQATLVFAGGLHPFAPDAWRIHTRECIKEIIRLKLTKSVLPLGRFLDEKELNVWLGAASVIMLNYHWVSGLYSASASSHRVLCAERPIIMNAQDVRLSEYENDVTCCKVNDDHLADAVSKCIENKEYSEKIAKNALAYAHETSFDKIAEKHLEMYRKCS